MVDLNIRDKADFYANGEHLKVYIDSEAEFHELATKIIYENLGRIMSKLNKEGDSENSSPNWMDFKFDPPVTSTWKVTGGTTATTSGTYYSDTKFNAYLKL
jgi:hypothetical protein